jgi:hypothetical protein
MVIPANQNNRKVMKRKTQPEVSGTIHVTAPQSLLAALQASAKAADRTQAAQVRHLLAWALKQGVQS